MVSPAYDVAERPRTASEQLNLICNLAKVGVAASDTNMNIKHLPEALAALLEQIHDISWDAVLLAEEAEKCATTGGDVLK